jgi:outer membrane protein OmpA-like peptidoglycan-associated protein
MRRFPTLTIAIEGHICCIRGDGDVTTTKGIPNLSQARAREVYNYLVANGISPKRLSYVGFGHRFPIFPFPEKDDDEKKANRRVEIRIVTR